MGRGVKVLLYELDGVAFVGVVVAVFVLAEVLEQEFLGLQAGDADEYLTVGGAVVDEIALVGIVGNGLLAVLVLDELEGRDIAMALGNVDIEAVVRETEQQFATLRDVLSIEFDGM